MKGLMDYAREDDDVYFWRLDGIGRSAIDVLNTVNDFTSRGVRLHSIMQMRLGLFTVCGEGDTAGPGLICACSLLELTSGAVYVRLISLTRGACAEITTWGIRDDEYRQRYRRPCPEQTNKTKTEVVLETCWFLVLWLHGLLHVNACFELIWH